MSQLGIGNRVFANFEQAMPQGGPGGGATAFYKAKQRYNLMSKQRYHITKY